MLNNKIKNDALDAEEKYKTAVESANDYIENFDILETITNVGNDEVFTPRKTCDMILDSLPEEVWHNPNYKWLNPATKNGIFEREIAIRLDKGLKDIIPDKEQRRKHILQNMIYAIGLTRFTANVARRTVYYCSQANRKCDGIKADDGHYVNGYAIGNGTWFDDEEGNIKTPITDHIFKKEKCIFCGISEKSKYNDPSQRETYAYEFIHFNKCKILEHLQDRFFGGNRNMKFDIIIGNPPYQLNDGGGTGSSGTPIYDKFVEQAIFLNPKYICMIIPSRWYSGGKGLDNFRQKILNDMHIKTLYDFENFKDVFPTVDLAGGACYFLRDFSYNGPCKIINVNLNGHSSICTRYLNKYNVFVRSNQSITIIDKVTSKYSVFLDKRVSTRLPFGISTTYTPKDHGILCYFTQKIGLKYIDSKDLNDQLNILNKWKFLVPKAPIAGQTDFSKPIAFFYDGNTRIAKPGECCSESWIVLGSFETEEETINFKSYIFTKIVRFLLLQTVVSQNITRKNFCFIPDLKKYDLKYTDEYLINLWKISNSEWNYIKTKISEIGINSKDYLLSLEESGNNNE